MPGESFRRRQAFGVVVVWRLSSANYLPWVLILKSFEKLQPLSVLLTLSDPSAFPIARTFWKICVAFEQLLLQLLFKSYLYFSAIEAPNQFVSVQDGTYVLGKAHNYALHPVSADVSPTSLLKQF